MIMNTSARSERTLAVALAPTSVAFLIVISSASVALAAGGGHHVNLHPEINWWSWDAESPPIGWFIVNFVIFVALLIRLAGKKVNEMFAARAQTIRDNVETNERELEAAEEEREEWQKKLASVDEEAKELVENSEADGERDKEKIVQSAKDYAERLRSDTGTIMEQEAASAQRDLQREVSLQALEKAESLLRSTISDSDRKRLFEQAVRQLASGKTEVAPAAGETAMVGGAP